jgi:arabinofuranan 3-O-arabinosyltransferase
VLAASWWALPLLVLGRYGYDFLDIIESAKVTTAVTGLVDTLRGSDHWLGYLVVDGRPVWTAGWELATRPGLVAVTALVAAAGLAGLLLPGLPDRRWLLGGVLLGTVLVSAAHTGVLTGPLAPALQSALDGWLAPLRNVHKADPVLRLPVALGLAHLLAVAGRAAGRVGQRVPVRDGDRVPVRVTGAVAVPVVAGLVAVTLLPAWGGGLAPQGAYAATPAYWQQASDWLDRHSDGDRTLLLPSANAPVYRWGTPRDEPLQAMASAPWAVRDGAPLGAPGSTRLLDGLDARLATGEPSPAYADALARAGIGFVLLRNDLDPDRSGSERPAVVRAALAGSPGLTEVAGFGPAQPPAFRSGDHRAGAAAPDPVAVEVFAVAGAERLAAYPDDGAVALSGGPEGVLSLADAGLLDGRAVMGTIDAKAADAADDAADAGTEAELPSTLAEAGTGSDDHAVVQTDTQRRRAYNPGADPDDRYSATLSAADPLPRPDLGPYDAAEQAVSVLEGASNVTASSSADDPFAADPDGVAHRGPDHRPAAAVDGDPATSWLSATGTVGQHLDLSLLRRTSLREMTVELLTDPALGPEVTSVAVTTDAGTASAPVRGGRATVLVRPGWTTRIRVTITGVAGDPDSGVVGIRELVVPGLAVTEAIALPPNQDTNGEEWTVLAERPDGRRGDCLRGAAGWICVPGLAEPGEESGSLERRFEAPAGDVTVAGTVRPRPGRGLDLLLDEAIGYRADGTSRITADPAARPGAAYDGDPATAWLPAPGDQAPRLTLALGRAATIRGLTGADWTGVAGVELTTRTGDRRSLTGPGRFRPVRTDEVTLTFRRAVTADAVAPMVVRGFDLTGAPARSTAPVQVDCGAAPAVVLDGRARKLSITTPVADLLTLAPVRGRTCGPQIQVAGGPHRMSSTATSALEVATAEVSSGRPPAAPPARTVRTVSWSDQHRVIAVAGGEKGYLAMAEGYNAGWRASAYGGTLTPVRMDGWQQGWKLPPGGATQVTLTFEPGRMQHGLLLGGLAAGLLVLLLALLPVRRQVRLRPDPLPPVPGRWWRAAPVAGVGVLLIGPVGLASAGAALALPRRWWAAGAGGALAVAGVLLAVDPRAGWVEAADQGLAAGALCVVTTALMDWIPRGDPARDPAGDPVRAEPVGQPQRRPLDQHPGQAAEGDRAERGEHGDRDRAPAEVGPAGDPVDRVEHDEVPEEDPVRPPPEQP